MDAKRERDRRSCCCVLTLSLSALSPPWNLFRHQSTHASPLAVRIASQPSLPASIVEKSQDEALSCLLCPHMSPILSGFRRPSPLLLGIRQEGGSYGCGGGRSTTLGCKRKAGT
ncbi:hypothetical protein D1007_53265 [Hordeum vulgare]|nr:hypothetical protein D1007_53265 [Hordeum vulgare]